MSDELKKAVGELTGLVKEMAESVKGTTAIKEEFEAMKEQIASYKAAARRGFLMPPVFDKDTKQEEIDEIFRPYNLAIQGKRLTDRMAFPKYQMSEESRLESAKWLILFLKASVFQDYQARMAMRSMFGSKIQKASSTDLGDTGNTFTVPTIVESEILAFAREQSVILQNARIWPMSSDMTTIPAESGQSAVAWGSTTSESNPSVSDVTLNATILSAYSQVNNELLEDTVSDIVSWILEQMAEAAGQEIDNSSFNGDGTSTYGYCSGILSAACGYSVTLGSGSTAFSQITATVLSEMIGKLDGLRKVGAMFYFHGSVLHFIRSLTDTNGKPIFIETIGAPMSGQIWGYPYKEVIKMPSSSAGNTAFGAFGNLRYFAVGRRMAPMTLMVDPYGAWTTDKTRFKLRHRWGLSIGLANGFTRLLTHS